MRTVWLIGHEGSSGPLDNVTWGAAALRIGDQLVNGVSRHSSLYEKSRIDKLSRNGGLTILDHSYRVPVRPQHRPVLFRMNAVVAVNLKFKLSRRHLIPGLLHGSRRGYFFNLLFESQEVYTDWANKTIDYILPHMEWNEISRKSLASIFLVMSCDHPEAGALRAFYSSNPDRTFTRELFSCRLKGKDLERFDAKYAEHALEQVKFVHAL